MINQIKEDLNKIKNKKIKICVDVGRNKREEYYGFVDKLYNRVWTFKTQNEIKSFSYNDVLIKTVIIKSK